MKRILLISISVFLLLATGCQREGVKSGLSGKTITASISVSLPADMATKAISDGTGASELLFLAYDAEDYHLEDLDRNVRVEGNKASISVNLVAGTGYKFVFWAQAPGKYAIAHDRDGHPVVTLAVTVLPDMMNNDAYDAFYAFKELDPQDSNFSMDVSLTRPFAQLNVAVSEADYTTAAAGYNLESLFQTSFSVKGVPGAIDLFTGKVSGETDVTYSPAAAPADVIISGQESYRRIAMVYMLAPGDQSSSHNVTLTVSVGKKGNGGQLDIQKSIPNVPMKRNYRTNLIGNVFSVGGTFTVQVDSDFGTPDNTAELTPGPAPIPEPEAVNLGLTSGLLWASFNVGATKPEEPGNYYAWGETETKDSYNWANYKWCKGTSSSLTRYCTSDGSSYWKGEGDPDGKTTFKDYDYADDVARQLLGGSWRTPTKEEWEELLNQSTHTADYYYGPNGQSILLPNTGFMNAEGLNNTDDGFYWSSSLQEQGSPGAAWFMNNHTQNLNTGGRSYGLAIRAVKMAEP